MYEMILSFVRCTDSCIRHETFAAAYSRTNLINLNFRLAKRENDFYFSFFSEEITDAGRLYRGNARNAIINPLRIYYFRKSAGLIGRRWGISPFSISIASSKIATPPKILAVSSVDRGAARQRRMETWPTPERRCAVPADDHGTARYGSNESGWAGGW